MVLWSRIYRKKNDAGSGESRIPLLVHGMFTIILFDYSISYVIMSFVLVYRYIV